jgi:hypothetical protein
VTAEPSLPAIFSARAMVASSSRSMGTTRFTRPRLPGTLGVDELAGGQHLEDLLARDVARKRHHGRGAEEPDIHPVHAEPRVLGRDRQIAGGHQLTARGGGDAVDLGDDRLGQARDQLHHRAQRVEEIAK